MHCSYENNRDLNSRFIIKELLAAVGLFLFFIFLTNCGGASETSQPGVDASISTEGLSDDFFAHPYFPHSDGWKDASSHGARALATKETLNDCFICHDKDSTDLGNSGSGTGPAGCKSCHDAFPHPENWGEATQHGQYVTDNGTGKCAGECHGTDLNGGLSGVSCNSCHAVFPHDLSTWKQKENHGQSALELGVSACQGCHGDDLAGGSSGVSCTSCHAIYPHATNWKNKDQHGKTVIEEGSETCVNCHGEDLKGGDTGVSCYQCHASYPHDAAWQDADQHGVAAKGNGKRLCLDCHGDDLTGGDTGVSCYQCHTIYPHDDSTATWSETQTWSDVDEHGQYVLDHGSSTCAGQCHGTDLSGGLSGISCLTGCHSAPYPHTAKWNDTAYKGTDDFHGNVGGGSGKSKCMVCHGDDLQGGTSGVSCFQCHADYPHMDENWVKIGMENTHATTFIQLVQDEDTDRCKVCHGDNYDREVGGVSCTNCHTKGITHTGDWSGGLGHGAFFSTNFTADDPEQYCQDCHGAPVKFTDGKTVSPTASICANCHSYTANVSSQTKTELKSASSCYTCHWAYPHIGYQVSQSDGNVGLDVAWGPTEGDLSGDESGLYYGHLLYQLRNPDFTDESGNVLSIYAPFYADGNEANIQANTCGGGTEGSCHFNGKRSNSNSYANSALCSLYCHQK